MAIGIVGEVSEIGLVNEAKGSSTLVARRHLRRVTVSMRLDRATESRTYHYRMQVEYVSYSLRQVNNRGKCLQLQNHSPYTSELVHATPSSIAKPRCLRWPAASVGFCCIVGLPPPHPALS